MSDREQLEYKLKELRRAVHLVNNLATEIAGLTGSSHGVVGFVPKPVERIQALVCEEFDVRRRDMLGNGRVANVALARQVAMWLARTTTKFSLQAIGAAFGRDHGTIIHAMKSIQSRIDTDAAFAFRVEGLLGRVNGAETREAA